MRTPCRLRLRVSTLLVLVLAAAAVSIAPAGATSPEEERLEATRAKIAEVRAELDAARNQEVRDAASLAEAERQLAVVTDALAAAEQAALRQRQAVDRAKEKLASLEQQEAQQRDAMAARAVTIYKQGGAANLTSILGSDTPADALRRTAFVDVVNRADQRSFEQVNITATAVEAQRKQLAVEEAALARVAEQKRQIAAEAEVVRDERSLVLAATSGRVDELQSQETHLEAESRELAAIARRAAREEAAARAAAAATAQAAEEAAAQEAAVAQAAPAPPAAAPAPAAAPSAAASGGGWTWPAAGPVTSDYGYRWGRLHSGTDIGAPSGAPVVAARAGVVSYAGSMSGYGNIVMIDHGGGISTAYAHQSAIYVSTGSSVGAGQQIGAVGSTGNSTGPHLHFEVRINGNPQDPRGYLP